MKTLSILLLAALSLTTACATDEAPRSGTPSRPVHKPALGEVIIFDTDVESDIDKVVPGTDALELDRRIDDVFDDALGTEWAEDRLLNGEWRTVLHHLDGRIELLD